MAEVIGDSRCVAANKNANKDQPKQRERLGAGEDILDELAKAYAQRIQEREKHNHQYPDELLHGQAYGVLRRKRKWRNDPSGGRNGGEQHAEVTREAHRNGGDRARLNYEEERPAVEKSPERGIRFTQVHVLSASMRKQRCQLAVRK